MSPTERTADARTGPQLALVWYGLGLSMLIGVLVLSLIPMPNTGVNDKVSHLVVYFLLAGWFGLLAGSRSVLLWTLVAVIAYGGLIELLQAMTTYRHADWADLLADAVGAVGGICLHFTPLRRLLLFVDRGLVQVFKS